MAAIVNSADVRWLDAQLLTQTGSTLTRPWAAPDQPDEARRWAWEGYSPKLTHCILSAIIHDAIVGYRELVELNFPRFGAALGLYSILPVDVTGIVTRFEDDEQDHDNELLFVLHRRNTGIRSASPRVDLELGTRRDRDRRWPFMQSLRERPRSIFAPDTTSNGSLPLHLNRPATSLAYGWLAQDLQVIGWLPRLTRFQD